MRYKKPIFSILIFIVILISSIIPITRVYATTPPSNYIIPQYVKYSVEMNVTVTDLSGTNDYYFMLPRLDNREPNSLMWRDTPPYQESVLLYHDIANSNPNPFLSHDRFNNTFDYFNSTNLSGTVSLSQHYNITLNEIIFSNISDLEIGEYDWNEDVFDLYCNNTEEYYDINDLDLIYASNVLSGILPADNEVEKAEKIGNFVVDHLTYDDTLVDEMGASWAYNNSRGDCSEYSSLMITLLRIQNIPARKVTGFVLSNNPSFKPSVGQEFTFSIDPTGGEKDFLGHAWVEYYVENIGWIPADPTWHDSSYSYINRIDYLRFNFNVGANWTIPFLSPPNDNFSEFPVPCIAGTALPDAEYKMKITILETNLKPNMSFILIISIVVIIGVIILVVLVVGSAAKKPKNRNKYNY